MANCLTSTGLIALLMAILFGGLFLADDAEPESVYPTLHPVVGTALPTYDPANPPDFEATSTVIIQNVTETAAAGTAPATYDPANPPDFEATATAIIQGATQTAVQMQVTPNN